MDKLPHVFVSPIDHNINNEQDTYMSDRSNAGYDVNKEINKILNSNRFKTKVKVYTDTYIKDVYIVSKLNDYIVTIDNEKININDIKKIELL